jgi:hypothetical protein
LIFHEGDPVPAGLTISGSDSGGVENFPRLEETGS